jgi:hypothetical protein
VAQTCDSMWAPRFVQRDPAQGELDAFKVNTTLPTVEKQVVMPGIGAKVGRCVGG